MPTPPRVAPGGKLGLGEPKAQRPPDVELLLKHHHAALAQHVDESVEELYERLSTRLNQALLDSKLSHLSQPQLAQGRLLRASDGVQDSSVGRSSAATAASSGAASNRRVRTYHDSMYLRKQTARDMPFSCGMNFSPVPSKPFESSVARAAKWLRSFVQSPKFEFMMCFLIVANTICLGVQVSYMAKNHSPAAFDNIDMFFTTVFTVELLLRFSAQPRGFFWSAQWIWNVVDTLVVLLSLVETAANAFDPDAAMNLTYIRVIRIARAVRIFRIVRVLQGFSSLRILVYCVFNTLKSLFWTIALLTVIVYMFGIVFTQAAAEHLEGSSVPRGPGPEWRLYLGLRRHYGSLTMAMFTLFKAVTGGVSWQDVSAPLGLIHPIWEGVFTCYITFTYFAVLNVVTGVFCQGAIDSAAHDKDMVIQAQTASKELYVQQVRDLFECIDSHKTGHVSFAMLEECLAKETCQAYFDALGIAPDDAWNLFNLLDLDDSNQIDLDEFVAGCLRLRGGARSLDSHLLLYESRWTMNKVTALLKALHDLADQLGVPVLESELQEDKQKFRGPSYIEGCASLSPRSVTRSREVDNRASVFSAAAFAPDTEHACSFDHKVKVVDGKTVSLAQRLCLEPA